MASELIIDLGNKRFAEVETEGPRPESSAADEQCRAERRQLAKERLLRRVREQLGGQVFLDRMDLLDLLIALGLDE
jgi:hypothetical protein